MWRKLKNLFLSCQTYADLSPDFQMRLRVNHWLRSRPALSLEDWYECYWQPRGVTKSVSMFVYTYLKKYSGLQFARVQPSDRLDRDLSLTLVCWFDWEMNLCEDFWQWFEIDLSVNFDYRSLLTVEDLVLFLNQQLLTVKTANEVGHV